MQTGDSWPASCFVTALASQGYRGNMHQIKLVPHNERGSQPLLRPPSMLHRHLISMHDLTPSEVDFLLKLAQEVKSNPAYYKNALEGRTLGMILEKPGLHARVTFELAISQLGGRALDLSLEEAGLAKGEDVRDVARNLSGWVDAIVARVQSHQTALELAEHATVPVINGLTDFEHPCQALSDFLTLRECKGNPEKVTLAWVGDGNNVAHSLIYGAARLGAHMRIATPPGFEPDRSVMADARREGGDVTLTNDPAEAVTGADAIYTDVWTSLGMEHEAEARKEVFRSYQVNSSLMRLADP